MESLKVRRSGIQEADRHTYTFADPDQGDMPFSTENGWLQILRKKALSIQQPTQKDWKNYCEEVYVKYGWEGTKQSAQCE